MPRRRGRSHGRCQREDETQQDDPSCDLDQTRDGKCTFLLPASPSCCCGGGCRCACRFKRVRVRVRTRRVLKTPFGKYLLRCLP